MVIARHGRTVGLNSVLPLPFLARRPSGTRLRPRTRNYKRTSVRTPQRETPSVTGELSGEAFLGFRVNMEHSGSITYSKVLTTPYSPREGS